MLVCRQLSGMNEADFHAPIQGPMFQCLRAVIRLGQRIRYKVTTDKRHMFVVIAIEG